MEPLLDDLKARDTADLARIAQDLKIEKATSLPRQELIFEIQRIRMRTFPSARASGVLEILPDGFGFLRSAESSYLPGPSDIYVSPSQIRKFHLRDGDLVTGQVRAPKEAERYFALIKLEAVDGVDPERDSRPLLFESQDALPPNRLLPLLGESSDPVCRVIDAVAPLATGQRVLLVSPLRCGRSAVIGTIARSLAHLHADLSIVTLLVAERPEDASEARRTTPGEVIATTFDEPASRHIQASDLVLERARRLAEGGRNVVLLLDSLTRLVRAHNEAGTSSGRVLACGLDPSALQRPRRLLASARRLSGGGSITVVATLLAETDSRLDEGILEGLEGLETTRITLDRSLLQMGLWPPVRLSSSWCRGLEHLLDHRADPARIDLQRSLSGDPAADLSRLLTGVQPPHQTTVEAA